MTTPYDESRCPIPPHRGRPGYGQAHDERIRELEAELARKRFIHGGTSIEFWKARAEKAEKALADMDKPWSANYWYVAWKESQARVAELEDAVAHAAAHSRNKKDDAIFMRALRGFKIEKAREREED